MITDAFAKARRPWLLVAEQKVSLMSEVTFESNDLLQALDASARARYLACFQRVELRRGDVLHNQGQMVDRVYFPLTGLVAILSETIVGESVQTGMIGCDGAIGAFEAMGSGYHLSKGLVQIPGVALRLSAVNYRELFNACAAFRKAEELYVERLLTEARQFMACNALHSVESRLSRSILDALDRSCLERVLPMTQESLALMLGAQRTAIAVVLSRMQRAGIIRNGRGAIEVRDQAALERLACSCRRTLQLARDEMQTPPFPARLVSSG